MIVKNDSIRTILALLYPEDKIENTFSSIQEKINSANKSKRGLLHKKAGHPKFSEKDIILICYGDHVYESDQRPLYTLKSFVEEHFSRLINGIHILPFFQFSSDDGFSIIDFLKVSDDLGDWQDIHAIGKNFKLMVDFVLNHTSTKNKWFKEFIQKNNDYRDFYIKMDAESDLASVVRPRTTPLLTPFATADGMESIWTTFSADQVDLNYANPQVLLKMLDVLLFYINQGAKIIRLDAVAYLWKIPGTSCINLPQTHQMVKLIRAILNEFAPEVVIITETNVPHDENISYFGEYSAVEKCSDEAQVVYQFPLAPLVLHTFLTGDSSKLLQWIQELPQLPEGMAFLNFTASHDGIGLRPVEKILTDQEIQNLIETTMANGGKVSIKNNSDGTHSVYELNASWFDAIKSPGKTDPQLEIARFIASQTIMLSLAGIVGIYFPSLFGSHNCYSCITETGNSRSINREKFNKSALERELNNPNNTSAKVFKHYKHLLDIRSKHAAFNPAADQKVIWMSNSVFSILRHAKSGEDILCLVNTTSKHQKIELSLTNLGLINKDTWKDLISGKPCPADFDCLNLVLAPYQSVWLRSE